MIYKYNCAIAIVNLYFSASVFTEIMYPSDSQSVKLTSINSVVGLYDYDKQNIKLIKIIKYGNEQYLLKILGTDEIFNNFRNILIEYNDISFI